MALRNGMANMPFDHTCEPERSLPKSRLFPAHKAATNLLSLPTPPATGALAEETHEMRRNVLLLLTLTVLTTANAGCCSSFRNWLHRGARCGTKTVAPAMMGSPVALGTPYVAPTQQAPVMQAPVMQQQCAPQQQFVPQQECIPQCVPQCVPMCQPCYDPCANMCCPDPCQGSWSGGYIPGSFEMGEGETYMPSGQTFVTPDSTITPGPAPETSANFPDKEDE